MNLNKLFITLSLLFVILIFTSYKYSESKEIGFNNSKILNDAKNIFDKNLTFRKWIAIHGGVYVPITKKTPSNPYLEYVANRDITTTTGLKFTLMNPAYALREFMHEFEGPRGEKSKMISLKLINPNNAPDDFEKEALTILGLKNKSSEIFKKIKNSNNQMELRYVKSLVVEKACLKCHSHKNYQNYKIGDIRGGISITLPLKRYEISLAKDLEYLQKIHLIALALGLVFLCLIYFYLKRQQTKELILNNHLKDIYNIFNNGNIVLFRWNNDATWSIDYVSDNVGKVFGYTKNDFMSGDINYASIIDKRDIEMVNEDVKIASKNGVVNFGHKPYRVKKKDGTIIWVNDSSQVIRDENSKIIFYVGYIQDITKQQNQEEILKQKIDEALKENTKQLQTLQQQSKMASMGEMIGAIAHQWRQPLNEIGLSIQNLKYDYQENAINEEFIHDFISSNKKTIMFMSHTIDDFRSFFRLDKEKKSFPVKEITKSVISMLHAQLNTHNIKVIIQGDEFEYYGFQSEYQQVILNILNNAKDAFEENNIQEPTIKIVLNKNEITICDNAGGISDDVIQRVFEPYFTTKEQGKGTGMGLYMSKMIIEDNMGGKLSVKNIDNGTCFYIEFD